MLNQSLLVFLTIFLLEYLFFFLMLFLAQYSNFKDDFYKNKVIYMPEKSVPGFRLSDLTAFALFKMIYKIY